MGRNSAPPALVLILPGRPVFYGSEVTDFCWGDSLKGPPTGARNTDQSLCVALLCLRRTTGRPSSACGGIPPVPLLVYTIGEGGEAPGRRPRPVLPRYDFLSLRRRLVPPRPRRQHHRGLMSTETPVSQLRSALQQDAELDKNVLHGGSNRGLYGPVLERLSIIQTCGEGAALCTVDTAYTDLVPCHLCLGGIHIRFPP